MQVKTSILTCRVLDADKQLLAKIGAEIRPYKQNVSKGLKRVIDLWRSYYAGTLTPLALLNTPAEGKTDDLDDQGTDDFSFNTGASGDNGQEGKGRPGAAPRRTKTKQRKPRAASATKPTRKTSKPIKAKRGKQ